MKHEMYARQPSPDLTMSADDLAAGIVSDLGGESELSTLERSYVAKIRDTDILARAAARVVVQDGLRTRAGQAAADKMLSAIQTFDRLAQRIGLKRRTKPARTIEDYIAAHAERTP